MTDDTAHPKVILDREKGIFGGVQFDDCLVRLQYMPHADQKGHTYHLRVIDNKTGEGVEVTLEDCQEITVERDARFYKDKYVTWRDVSMRSKEYLGINYTASPSGAVNKRKRSA